MFGIGPRPSRGSVVRRSRPRSPVLVTAIVLIILVLRFINQQPQDPLPPPGEQPVPVVRVVDGDTLLLEGGVRIRLLGVNTPEIEHDGKPAEPLGHEAAAFTRRLVGQKSVTLEYDRERLDDYGRTLAYVYVDRQMLNEALIEAGLSQAVTRHPYRSDRKRLFEEAEQRARSKQIGIWAHSPPRQPRSSRPGLN